MRSIARCRRTSVAVLSTLALGGAALAFTGAPATARPVEPAAAPAAASAVNSGNQISKEAWAAGKAKFGANVTAAQALAAYWTPARMAAAKPIEESQSYKDMVKRLDTLGVPEVAPNIGPMTKIKPAPGSGVKFNGGGPSPAAANPNFPVGHPTARTSGKAFFNTPGGGGACSGTIINSEGGNTVWTAGHCVNQGAGGAWFTNWVFVPNYDIDLANPVPYGVWSANQLWSLCGWTCPGWGNFTYDMGVAIMNPLNGWRIVHFFGGQGLIINTGVNQWINSFGYPSEPPFSGGHLWQCWGANFWEVVGGTTQIPCDMNRGSSGGGWLWGWDGNWGWLNGVNSRVDRLPGPTLMKAPYFDNDALTLYNATRNL